MAVIRRKQPMIIIRIKLKCFPPLAAVGEAGVEGILNGAALGDISRTGAVIIRTTKLSNPHYLYNGNKLIA